MNLFRLKGLLPFGLICILLFLSVQVNAQSSGEVKTIPVEGVVVDAALGTPLVGISVQAYNDPHYAARTKADGTFTINVPEYVQSLVFSFETYDLTVCALKGRTKGIEVKMYSNKFSENYSVSTVASKSKSTKMSASNADLSVDPQIQLGLSGDVYTINRSGQLGSGISMMIDGVNSLNINTQPLVVLDGVILDLGYNLQSMHDGFYSNLLANIMPEDIENVTVLKNGTAIYGAKGANGVILINTKRNKSMTTKIDFSLAGTYQMLPSLPKMMDASQYRTYASELLGTTNTRLNQFKFLQLDENYIYYNKYHNETDWKNVVYRDAFLQNYSLNVQGGDEVANYNLSVGYAFGDATVKNTDFSRFNLRLNSDIILSDKIDLRFDASYSDVTRNMRDDGAPDDYDNSLITSPTYLSLIKAPFLAPNAHDNYGVLSHYLSNSDDYLSEALSNEYVSLANPKAILSYGESINKNYFANRMIALAVTPSYTVNNHLKVYEHFSYTLFKSDENYYLPIFGTPQFEKEGVGLVNNQASAMNATQNGFMSNTYLTYNRRFQAHDVVVSAGFRYLNNSLLQNSMSGYNSGNDKTPNMTSSLKYKKTDGIDTKDVSLTYWAQGDYNFAEKYYVSAGIGISASSRFGGNVSNGAKMFGVPWGFFPSIQAAWVATSEPWFKVKFIDYLKLNAGFDLSGNDGFDDSASRTYFGPVRLLGMSGLVMSNIGNSSLQWETTKKLTFGADMSLFSDRLGLSVNYFHSNTDNLLSISDLSYLTGLPNSWSNGGSLKNDGFDVTAQGKIINGKNVKWEAGLSVGHYKTEITKLPVEGGYTYEAYGATIKTEVGSGVGYFYGYKTDGVFATARQAADAGLYNEGITGLKEYYQAGDVKFVDQDGNHKIDKNDMVKIGDPTPDLYGRIFTSVYYKNFSLSATLTYSLGNDVYNYQRMLLESGSRFNNQTVAMTNRWISEGQQTDMPKAVYGDPMNNNRFSDRWIEDGSYLRIKNVTLSYKLPQLGKASEYIKGVSVWAAANNLATFTKYLGSDPEFSVSNNILSSGIDCGLTPQSPSISLGVKINL